MPLESLLELVETLRKRIDKHGAALRQSEALTRYALVDPLLRELGWNTEDPAMVMPEYRLGKGYADYALLRDGKPAIMVEAKKLGTALQDAASQGIGYCIEDGIGYFAVTDGQLWEIYETHKMAPIAEKMIVEFDLTGSPAENCLKALALWRNEFSGAKVSIGQPPVTGFESESLAALPTPISYATPLSDDHTGKSLPDFMPEPRSKPPSGSKLVFPDGTSCNLSNWKSIPIEVTTWLIHNKHLSNSDCPVQIGKATKRYALNSKPVHSDGTFFVAYQQIETLYLDMDHTFQGHIKNAQGIVSNVGLDPARFKVQLP